MTTEELMDDLLKCSACDIPKFQSEKLKNKEIDELIGWYYHKLPFVKYALEKNIEYIFSNGFTTGDDKQDDKLERFLYQDLNIKGDTNYSVIQESVRDMLIFGRSGIRLLEKQDGLLNVNHALYATLTADNEKYFGFKDVLAYVLSTNGSRVENKDLKNFDFDEDTFKRKGVLYLKEQNLLLESKDQFINLRKNTSKDFGESPLMFDQQRLKLLAMIYDRLLYDLEYDGTGRLLLWLDDNSGGTEDVPETTAKTLTNNSEKAKKQRKTKAQKEASAVAEVLKNLKSNEIGVVSSAFKKLDQLPRVTKSTEFFDYLKSEGEIVSQLFGLPPTLLGQGRISGNVSMEKIIDNAMLNTVVPMRESIAVQLSAKIAPMIGVEKIYFNKYEMQQKQDNNDRRNKLIAVANGLKNLGFEDYRVPLITQ